MTQTRPVRRSLRCSSNTSPMRPNGPGSRRRFYHSSGSTPSAGSQELFGAWRTFFERLVARADPWSWSSRTCIMPTPGLLDFIDHIMEWSRNVPILIVTLARPELLERRTNWGAGKRSFTSIHLEPLPTAAMRELLAGLVTGLPVAAANAIVGPRRRDSPLCGRNGSDASCAGPACAQGRDVPAGRRPDRPGRAGNAHGADQRPTRRAGRSRPRARLGRCRSWARASRWRPWPPWRARIRRPSNRACAGSSDGSCSCCRPTRARRSAASTRSSRP